MVLRGSPEGAAEALLALEECSWLSSPALGAPAENEEMVDCLVRAMGVDVRERGMGAGGGSRNAEVVVEGRFLLTYIRTEKE